MKALENILSKITYHKYQKELSSQCILKAEFIAEKLANGEFKELEENMIFMFKRSLEIDHFDQMIIDFAKEAKRNYIYERNAYFFIRYGSISEIQLIAYDKENDLNHIASINEWCFCDIEEIIKTFTEMSLNIFSTINFLLHETYLIPPEEREEGNYNSYKLIASRFLEGGEHEIMFGLPCIRMTKDNKIVLLTDEEESEEFRKRSIILTNSFRSMESELKKKSGSSLFSTYLYLSQNENSYKRYCYLNS